MKAMLLALVVGAAVVAFPAAAHAGKALPPTLVTVNGNSTITVSTTINTSRYDTYVYIKNGASQNFIYHQPVPATIGVDPAWNCPCTAQIVNSGKSGTFKVLTAESAPFTP